MAGIVFRKERIRIIQLTTLRRKSNTTAKEAERQRRPSDVGCDIVLVEVYEDVVGWNPRGCLGRFKGEWLGFGKQNTCETEWQHTLSDHPARGSLSRCSVFQHMKVPNAQARPFR